MMSSPVVATLLFLAWQTPPEIELVGSTEVLGQIIRLTPAAEMQSGAIWRRQKMQVRSGFETTFSFRITDTGGLRNGADGLAFVIQNNGSDALAGRGNSGGFGFGDGRRDSNSKAIPNSFAVFFDTHQNEDELSGNSVSFCTNGAKQSRWPPPRLSVNWSPRINWKDGEVHKVRIAFAPPVMTVWVDGLVVLRGPVDLGRMIGADGSAYVGFTASTGAGWENHDLLSWHFEPNVTSGAYTVDSEISFASFECMPSKSLCTPQKSLVEESAPGTWHVILPAHLEWGAEIPNPRNLPVEIKNARGTACWDPAEGECGSPSMVQTGKAGALLWRNQKGRTAFTLQDQKYRDNQGYYEFEVILKQ